ncbi:hypothetical protein IQ268_19305 [Oculatella sp. LEGE 06141]|uniref:hypothetical protein n=1 Tax=Oculatella sp. LEGE 06141 TaxID=1828648 RepID=UPI00187F67BF|nr:hypothetical protein [Oculatella sp. LEGE 06141]MBE9180710.1 hypothetical protein [Oculatella sp. LEGE 06141]
MAPETNASRWVDKRLFEKHQLCGKITRYDHTAATSRIHSMLEGVWLWLLTLGGMGEQIVNDFDDNNNQQHDDEKARCDRQYYTHNGRFPIDDVFAGRLSRSHGAVGARVSFPGIQVY